MDRGGKVRFFINTSAASVKVDLANAFNECTRAAMLAAVAREPALAGLLPLYSATLSVASPLYMTGTSGHLEKIGVDCQEGGHQGCASTGAATSLRRKKAGVLRRARAARAASLRRKKAQVVVRATLQPACGGTRGPTATSGEP